MTDAPQKPAPRPLCAQPPERPVVLPPGLAPGRERAIRLIRNKWVNGTVLHYCFVDLPRWPWSGNQKAVVRGAFATWKALGIGLEFVEVNDPTEAELRIGFDQSDGSWSYVGTDVLRYEDRGRTMNFGWDLTDAWGEATALHEIGHAVGMPHEHQSPLSGIVWNEEAVYATYSGPPNNWERPDIFHNILRKLGRSEVEGSNWDPASIMHYPFEPGLIVRPQPYDANGIGENVQLSPNDIAWVRRFYPPRQAASPIVTMELQPLSAESLAQRDFEFSPEATRDYTIRTVGASDVKLVVFEERDGEPRHLAAEDDSGTEENAEISIKLVKGRRYFIRARTHYAGGPAKAGLLVL